MTIKVYPSRLPGEPLETHIIDKPTTLGAWLSRNVEGYEPDIEQPISIDVDGAGVHPHEWFRYAITAESDVRIYPVPFGVVAVAIAVVAVVAVAALVMAMSIDAPGQPGQGDKIDTNPAKANLPKRGEPVREVLGRRRIFPDYLNQPVTRFVNRRTMQTSMLLSVGVGQHSILASSIKVGDTPLAAFGSDASYTIYEPGASVASDPRSECWYVAGEVGATNGGTQGLDLASTAPSGTSASADAVILSGTSLTLAGAGTSFPDVWAVNTIIALETPNTYSVSEVAGYSRIAGQLDDLAPFVGQKVTLGAGADRYDLVVHSYAPYVPPTPGVGGSPSSVVASAAPTTYDFSDDPIVWTVTYQGQNRTISLAADYLTMSGLVAEISSQLSGTGLSAQDVSGRLRIAEPLSPYQGGVLSQSSAPVEIFGIGPIYTVGTASSGGTPESQAFITLRHEDGTPFIGLPTGSQRLSLGYRGYQYRITSLSGQTMTVARLTDTGATDTGWPGFTGRTLLDFDLTSDTAGTNWLGWFMACPEGELVTYVEYDVFLPNGLIRYSDSGNRRTKEVPLQFEWRDAATGGAGTVVSHTIVDRTDDSLGFTFGLTLPYPMRPQMRGRRLKPLGGAQVKDQAYWYGLRSRLAVQPASYPGITTFALTLRTGDRLGAQSDRRVNLVATRIYNEGATRSVRGAALCVLDSLGIPRNQVDEAQLQALENTYWSPRGETFDYAFTSRSTVRDVLQMIFNAGMGHLVLSAGLISATREGVQAPKGMLTPHEMTEPLRVGFLVPSADDFTGVDVEYTSSTTWATETVPCRLPGVTPGKIETYKLDGVTNRTRAWRIGMRRLRKYQGQRLSFDCSTELDALCYEYLDHIVLADDEPETTQSTLIVDAYSADGLAYLTLTEPLDWSVSNPRCLIRRHDGTVTPLAIPTQIDEYTLAIPESVIDFDLITDGSIEEATLLFGPSTQIGYPALVQSIDPGADGSCGLTAIEYRDDYYADDNNVPA